jgi:hypothetical protein
VARIGDRVASGVPVLIIHHHAGRGLEEAQALLSRAIEVSDPPVPEVPIVVARLSGEAR